MVWTTPKCVLVNVITAELSASQKDVWSNQSKRLTAVIRINVASHSEMIEETWNDKYMDESFTPDGELILLYLRRHLIPMLLNWVPNRIKQEGHCENCA
ncbi:MAG TPA: hypothetical protein VE572_03115 [Nitrososphaeraceae archaeon]|jgi:hypothetical protein|nr:hypothetical protein [Nitrososphaeraceae archaeon]